MTAGERAEWHDRAKHFLKQLSGVEEDTAVPQGVAHLERVGAYNFLVAIDNQLQDLRSSGLKLFAPTPSDSLQAICQRPTLIVTADQDSKGFCASWFTQYELKLRVWHTWDPCHRVHNDIMDAASASGLRHVIVLGTILFNVAHGPWQGAAFFRQMQEEARNYASMAGKRPCVPILRE